MTGEVVIRCPQCGTTQPALGECDACHEADARYFCTNHVPGRWLDGPQCPTCGARHGAPARVDPRLPTPAAPRRGDAPPLARRRAAPPPEPEEPEVRVWEEVSDGSPWGAGRRWPDGGRAPLDGRGPRAARWPDGLPFPVVRVGGGTLLGCAARLVMSVVLFVVLAVLAFFGYCGSV